MDPLNVPAEIERLSKAFSDFFFITPAEFVAHCDVLLSLLLMDHSLEQQLQVLGVLELAVSAFQSSVYPATLSMTMIFEPPNVEPESWKMMALLMQLTEQIASMSFDRPEMQDRTAGIVHQYAQFHPGSQLSPALEQLQESMAMDADDVFRSPVPAIFTDFSRLPNPLLHDFLRDSSSIFEPPSFADPHTYSIPSATSILSFEAQSSPAYYAPDTVATLSSSMSAHILGSSINRSVADKNLSTSPSLLESIHHCSDTMPSMPSFVSAHTAGSSLQRSGIEESLSTSLSILKLPCSSPLLICTGNQENATSEATGVSKAVTRRSHGFENLAMI